VVAPPTITSAQLVDLIAAVIHHIEAQRAKVTRSAQTARDAMWATFAAQYPEISTGNLVTGADEEFIGGPRPLMELWLDMNLPRPHLVPAHIAAVATAGHTTGSEDRER
jgi:heme A synthase